MTFLEKENFRLYDSKFFGKISFLSEKERQTCSILSVYFHLVKTCFHTENEYFEENVDVFLCLKFCDKTIIKIGPFLQVFFSYLDLRPDIFPIFVPFKTKDNFRWTNCCMEINFNLLMEKMLF